MAGAVFFVLSGTGMSEFNPQKSDITIKVNQIESSHKIMTISVLPEEAIPLEILTNNDKAFNVSAEAGILDPLSGSSWNWRAPKDVGLYRINIYSDDKSPLMTLNCFVTVPYSTVKGKEYIDNYRMGAYPEIAFRNLPIYLPPKGFIKVTAENKNMKVSPHFLLSQFVCKQDSVFPKYMVLQTKLLLKLELILEHVNKNGFACETFHVMSGYRTPFYNRSIGNVKYSRHVWGGAADIFIDEFPENGYMDDLNKDGFINWKDAEVLYDLIDGLYGKSFYEKFVGGLGWYRKKAAHGPFVHVDVRGNRARWGD